MIETTFKKKHSLPVVYKKLTLGNCSYGKAVFAAEHIHPGDVILKFGGSVIPSKELPYPYEHEKDYFLQIGEDMYLGPSGDMDDYVNHSCDPNCGIKIQHNEVVLIAISFIKKGDQITFNYSTTMNSDWGEFRCSCGSSNCLDVVRNFITLPPLIQKKYLELDVIPDYILAKIIDI